MKNKLKPLVKEAKKIAQKSLHQTLVAQLKEATAKFGVASKKLDKKIEKEAKKLAKKFAKDIKIDTTTLVKAEEPKAPEAPKTGKPVAAAKAKTTPAAKKAETVVTAS
ncbi:MULTISPECIES: hypothetical protein [unclassified Mucilaginibacter]|uniref:hypothetical protein n=1 Tax=unclassified Mucilaginibacter TaxID=2617802 RepID=UPI002AC8C901|nr:MULTISPECIES: hypothetical protein [unclassified Mucilaginibacter]MEB0260311.1 hypothetical protein [Mucilaginibacter sp. 10I4]MEB0279350.1 hypothetical protein [Mucilaginibacter sp. 10B2]MEB0302206.1 hypothetical protein [Mucilaginibacter sp. 5C4]WPX21723.1 hypothetical protein RHM67_10545 [Mucilaginibacter sp. 5C4]